MEETTDMDHGDTSDDLNEEDDFDDLSVTVEELIRDMQRLQELEQDAEEDGVIITTASSGDAQEVR